jgi:hypothetical protein
MRYNLSSPLTLHQGHILVFSSKRAIELSKSVEYGRVIHVQTAVISIILEICRFVVCTSQLQLGIYHQFCLLCAAFSPTMCLDSARLARRPGGLGRATVAHQKSRATRDTEVEKRKTRIGGEHSAVSDCCYSPQSTTPEFNAPSPTAPRPCQKPRRIAPRKEDPTARKGEGEGERRKGVMEMGEKGGRKG